MFDNEIFETVRRGKKGAVDASLQNLDKLRRLADKYDVENVTTLIELGEDYLRGNVDGIFAKRQKWGELVIYNTQLDVLAIDVVEYMDENLRAEHRAEWKNFLTEMGDKANSTHLRRRIRMMIQG